MKTGQETSSYAALLREAGFKATPRRMRLLDILDRAQLPLSIPEILDRAGSLRIDPATAYRAMKELADAGLVRQVDLRQGAAAYELASHRDHHHLVCVRCGRVEDFVGCRFEAIARTALKQSRQFQEITQHSLELFGLCKGCAR